MVELPDCQNSGLLAMSAMRLKNLDRQSSCSLGGSAVAVVAVGAMERIVQQSEQEVARITSGEKGIELQ